MPDGSSLGESNVLGVIVARFTNGACSKRIAVLGTGVTVSVAGGTDVVTPIVDSFTWRMLTRPVGSRGPPASVKNAWTPALLIAFGCSMPDLVHSVIVFAEVSSRATWFDSVSLNQRRLELVVSMEM